MADKDKASKGEKWNPLDPDAGWNVRKLWGPVGNLFEADGALGWMTTPFEQNGTENKLNDNFFVKAGGGAGGALLGYKLGSNFGTLGKLGGAVIGAWGGCKLSQEVASDYGAAKDYAKNNGGKDFMKAFGSNLLQFNGQKYNGHSEADAEAEL